ncbi:hypothetical protein FO519_001494 [Halicephalobus sp. NKZ332]|nr:hypothetical protein FO519_001494 [Halicephalobus sp. NKZ332]
MQIPLVLVLCLTGTLAFKLPPAEARSDISPNDPATVAEKLAFFSALMHDLKGKIHEEESGQQVRRSMTKERRAPMENFDDWEGMMESLDNLRKPRFG